MSLDQNYQKKIKAISELDEETLTLNVLMPVFKRMGYSGVEYVHGAGELGKDLLLIEEGLLNARTIVSVQVKTGRLNLSGKSSSNAILIADQLKTSLRANVSVPGCIPSQKPDRCILVTSGEVSQTVRQKVHEHLQDIQQYVQIIERAKLIELIDEYFSEYWHGLDPLLFPYLRALVNQMSLAPDFIALPIVSQDVESKEALSPFHDDVYVDMHLFRPTVKVAKSGSGEDKLMLEHLKDSQILYYKEKCCLVTGDAGAGKSTLLRRLAFKEAQKALSINNSSRLLPVFLRAGDIARADASKPLLEIIRQHADVLSEGASALFTEQAVRSGRVVVFLDAADEVWEENEFRRVAQKFTVFTETYKYCRCVVSCREVSVSRVAPAFKLSQPFTLEPITLRQAEKVVRQVVQDNGKDPETARRVLDAIRKFHGIELTPIIVTLFAASFDANRVDVPPNITEIFKKYTEELLGRWDVRKGVSQQHEAPVKDLVLRHIALKMHTDGVQEVPESILLSYMKVIIDDRSLNKDESSVLEELIWSGLLQKEEGYIRFPHLMFQEFFAGRALRSLDSLLENMPDPWWSYVGMFYIGDDPGRHEDVIALLSHKFEDISPQELFYAAYSLGLMAQAAYFANTAVRQQLLDQTIECLAIASQEFLKKDLSDDLIFMEWLSLTIFAKEAPASSVTKLPSNEEWESCVNEHGLEFASHKRVWLAVSLLSQGRGADAKAVLKGFDPPSDMLAFSIFLAATSEIAVGRHSDADKEAIRDIIRRFSSKVPHLLSRLRKAFESYILEIKDRLLVSVDQPVLEAKSGQYILHYEER